MSKITVEFIPCLRHAVVNTGSDLNQNVTWFPILKLHDTTQIFGTWM
jgi:hypothetical protein